MSCVVKIHDFPDMKCLRTTNDIGKLDNSWHMVGMCTVYVGILYADLSLVTVFYYIDLHCSWHTLCSCRYSGISTYRLTQPVLLLNTDSKHGIMVSSFASKVGDIVSSNLRQD